MSTTWTAAWTTFFDLRHRGEPVETVVGHLGDADVRVLGGERVRRGERAAAGEGVVQRALARVGEADQAEAFHERAEATEPLATRRQSLLSRGVYVVVYMPTGSDRRSGKMRRMERPDASRSVAALAASTLAAAPVVAIAIASSYLSVLTLAAWRAFRRGDAATPRTPSPRSNGPSTSFTILVPAHDEELLVADTVDHLIALDYPHKLFDVHVVADHCGDATVEIARDHGATVLENVDPDVRGKGPALRWAFDRLDSRERSETSSSSSTPTRRPATACCGRSTGGSRPGRRRTGALRGP